LSFGLLLFIGVYLLGFFLYLFKNLRLILKTKTGSELIYEKQTGFKKAIWFGLIICFKKTNAD
jgi:hypothetical protein